MSATVDPAFWHGKRVLLTGHTDFKGSWCASLAGHILGWRARYPHGATIDLTTRWHQAVANGACMRVTTLGQIDAMLAYDAVR